MSDRGKKRQISASYAAVVVSLTFLLFAVGTGLCFNSSGASRSTGFKIARSLQNPAQTEPVPNKQTREITSTSVRVIPFKPQEGGVRPYQPQLASPVGKQEIEIGPAPRGAETITAGSARSRSEVGLLPPVFNGCWSGSVAKLDTIHLFRPPQITLWVTKTYRLCYQRVSKGSSQPTLSEAGLNNEVAARLGTELGNVIGRLKVMSTDLRTRAEMRAFLHFNERPTNRQSFRFPSGLVDELTTLDCQIDGVTMHVEAFVYGEYDATPWFTASWRADFLHLQQ